MPPFRRGSMSRFPRTNAGARRRVSWGTGPRGNVGAVTAAGSILFPVGAQANLDDLTIVRIRGELLVRMKDGTSADSSWKFAFGMCIVNENAFGIGVTAVPQPFTDLFWDGWMVHQQGIIATEIASEPANQINSNRIIIDSKAMRKTHLTDIIVAVIEFHSENGTAIADADLVSRSLSKLA